MRFAEVIPLKTRAVVDFVGRVGMLSYALRFETILSPLGQRELNFGTGLVWVKGWGIRYVPLDPKSK